MEEENKDQEQIKINLGKQEEQKANIDLAQNNFFKIVISVVVLAGIIFFTYTYIQKLPPFFPTPTPTPTPTVIPISTPTPTPTLTPTPSVTPTPIPVTPIAALPTPVNISEWKETSYANSHLGIDYKFTFKYPPNWVEEHVPWPGENYIYNYNGNNKEKMHIDVINIYEDIKTEAEMEMKIEKRVNFLLSLGEVTFISKEVTVIDGKEATVLTIAWKTKEKPPDKQVHLEIFIKRVPIPSEEDSFGLMYFIAIEYDTDTPDLKDTFMEILSTFQFDD